MLANDTNPSPIRVDPVGAPMREPLRSGEIVRGRIVQYP
jgi:hypothetical protein